MKNYTLKDFITDIKYFGGIGLFLILGWFSYSGIYYLLH